MKEAALLDATDRAVVNALQDGLPLTPRPYADSAAALGIGEQDHIARLERLLATGVLTRFGPLYDAERLGGAFCLCAMAVPQDRFEEVVGTVNAHREVAHNYARDHIFNMWFVLASEDAASITATVRAIEAETGLAVYAFPKLREFFIGFRVAA
jgi:DNA-binding Lrp family transcriptional regulator